MSLETTSDRRHTADSKPLVSHTSILILSVFLLGLVAGKLVDSGVEIYVTATGIVGVAAYLGLAHLARRRREHDLEAAHEQAVRQLTMRLERHVQREPHMTAGPRATSGTAT